MTQQVIVIGSIIISGIYLIWIGYKALFLKSGCGCSGCPSKGKK